MTPLLLDMLDLMFRPTYDALFCKHLPFTYRWRLLVLQPIQVLIMSFVCLPWLTSRRYTVIWIPTRLNRKVRALVFQPPRSEGDKRLRPLHLDIHGGAFLGGAAEYDARWCSTLSDKTGAVVVSTQYRYSPRYTFPSAHDDVDDVVAYLLKHAESELGADTKLFTIGGTSAGGNLALAACQQPALRHPSLTAIKASVTFYAPVDLRRPPMEKPVPKNYPAKDPLFFLQPLYDAYVACVRPEANDNPRLHPILAELSSLPNDMLFIVPAIDILMHEQLALVQRLKREADELAMSRKGKKKKRIEARIYEKGFHGWLECKS